MERVRVWLDPINYPCAGLPSPSSPPLSCSWILAAPASRADRGHNWYLLQTSSQQGNQTSLHNQPTKINSGSKWRLWASIISLQYFRYLLFSWKRWGVNRPGGEAEESRGCNYTITHTREKDGDSGHLSDLILACAGQSSWPPSHATNRQHRPQISGTETSKQRQPFLQLQKNALRLDRAFDQKLSSLMLTSIHSGLTPLNNKYEHKKYHKSEGSF